MMHRALFLCVAVFADLASHAAAFSNAPARGLTAEGLLKGAAVFPSNTSLNAEKKAVTKAATKKQSVEKEEDVVKFKKADFVSAVAEKTGMTKVQSELAMTAVLDVLATEVAAGKQVALPGFGTFKLSHRAARKGRNPSTGEEIDIRALNVPSFSASKILKELCNPDRI